MKTSLKKILFAVGVVVVVSFLVIFFLTFYLPGHTYIYYYKNYKKVIPVTTELPIRIIIPKINVDADIEYVGLDSAGAMDGPKSSDKVAWFELGPRPGEVGSAVIAGHYGFWKSGQGSVFDNLNKLIKGDKLYIEDKNGTIITFIVRELRRYNPSADASNVFNSNDGASHLNLITCEGIWDAAKQTYSDRLIIFADKEIK